MKSNKSGSRAERVLSPEVIRYTPYVALRDKGSPKNLHAGDGAENCRG